MAGWRYFVCPVEFNNDSNSFQVDCEPSELFQLQDYGLPSVLESLTGWVRRGRGMGVFCVRFSSVEGCVSGAAASVQGGAVHLQVGVDEDAVEVHSGSIKPGLCF